MPDEPECSGLLALLLATHARRATRLGPDGQIVLLADQDRSRWDRVAIEEASSLIDSVLRRRRVGPYQIQGAIAAVHSSAVSYEATDWAEIVALYGLLEFVQPTPVVRVNRAVAVAELDGPERGLELLEGLEGVESWHLYWSTRAGLLSRAGNPRAAVEAYERALDLPMNDSDRLFLETMLNSNRALLEP
jgi:RNA polymerase sigma-70 factor (ECF subfamily)